MHEDDLRIIVSFLAGDAEAAAEIEAWVVTALRSFRGRLGNDCEDLVQEAVLEVTRLLRQGGFQGRSRLRTYVWRLVTSRAIDRLRARGRRRWANLDGVELPSPRPSPLDVVLTRETVEIALRVAAAMPESCRELWRMLLEGMSYRGMAEEVGVAEGTLRVRVLRCRDRALEARERLLGLPSSEGNVRPEASPNS